jgi:hypothetical protein
LATFAVSVETDAPLAAGQLRQIAHTRNRRFATLLVSALTLFAFAIEGYHPYAEDGGLYLAGVKRLLNPALYPHSTAFVLEPMRHSLFASMVAAIVRLAHVAGAPFMQFHRMSGVGVSQLLGLPLTLLVLHLATIWATLFAAWMLASRCWPARTARAGAVVLLACWLSLPVAGTALAIMDPYLTARSISTPCTLLALAFALDATAWLASPRARRRGLILWIASIALAAAMHPLMAAYALGATLFLACLRSTSPRSRRWSTAALALASIVAAACIHFTAAPDSSAYQRIALTRTYWFPASWSWYELIGLAAPLAILAIFALRTRLPHTSTDSPAPLAPARTLSQAAIAAGATAWLTATLFAHASSATHLVARMQPLRVFHLVYLVMILLLGAKLGAALGDRPLRRAAWRWAAATILLGGIMFSAARSAFPSSPHLELPWIKTRPTNPWVQAFLWIRDNTPVDAFFALPADYINSPGEDAQCFRAIAERSALPDYSKDGGEASIAPELTPAWTTGQQAQQQLTVPTLSSPVEQDVQRSSALQQDAARISTLTPLGVTWLVLNTSTATTLTCPYTNSAVKVCELRP